VNPEDWCDDPSRGWDMAGRENGSGVEGHPLSITAGAEGSHGPLAIAVAGGPRSQCGAGIESGLPFSVSTDPWLLLTQEAK